MLNFEEKDFGIKLSIFIIVLSYYYEYYSLVLLPVVLLLTSLTFPFIYKYPNKLFNLFLNLIGNLINYFILFIIFYFVLTPIGLLRRMIYYFDRTSNNKTNNTNYIDINKVITKEDLVNPY
jgi:hypothetical protein